MRVLYPVLALVILVLIAGCAEKEPLKPAHHKVAFLSTRAADTMRTADIFLYDLKTRELENLTEGKYGVTNTSNPVLSPDASSIIFVSYLDAKKTLSRLLVETKEVTSLTRLEHDLHETQIDPVTGILYFVDKVGGKKQIFSIQPDGTHKANLSKSARDDFEIDLSTDGLRIVFTRLEGENYSIWTMNSDGSEPKRLTDLTGNDRTPAFSPDGTQIVFSANRFKEKDGDYDICLISSDGGEVEALVNTAYYESAPKFSPDGEFVAFVSNRRGMPYRDVLLTSLDGEVKRNLTMGVGQLNQNFSFTGDAKGIVFENVKYNNAEIYYINIDATGQENLTNNPAWDSKPVQ